MTTNSGLFPFLGIENRPAKPRRSGLTIVSDNGNSLRQSEARFRSLAEHTTDLVLSITGPGIIDYVSPNARAILGYSPDDMLGWNLLAQAYRDAKQPQRAVQALSNAHLVSKGTAETWFLLGESYSDLDRYLPAASAYREAIKMNGEFVQAWFGVGRAYARLNRRAEFEQALKTLERLSPPLAKELAEMRPASR